MPYKDTNKRKSSNKVYSQRYYEKNKALVIARASVTNKVAIDRNKRAVFEYLQDKACVDCSESETVVLTFDHLRDKKWEISYMVFHAFALKTIFDEISKCVVRCFNCHLRDEAKKRGVWKSTQTPLALLLAKETTE